MNQTIVEEVLQDLRVLDFGKGITADSNVSIWRGRDTHHHPLCSEFAFQAKFKRRDEVHEKAINRCPAVLYRAAAVRSRLAVPRHDQDRSASIGLKATRPRVMSNTT